MDISGTRTKRLLDTINAHDLDAFAATFAVDYDSQQPVHPGRAFIGRATARSHWANFFALVPDFQAEVLRFARDGETEWAEWRWFGTQADGKPFEVRGVILLGVRRSDGEDEIAWGRLYMEPVEAESPDHYAALGGRPAQARRNEPEPE